MKPQPHVLRLVTGCVALALLFSANPRLRHSSAAQQPSGYNIKTFGAKGDGKTIDTPAINKAIDAAAAAGGGTVYFPAGNYLSVSIRLKSHVALYLDHGATIA